MVTTTVAGVGGGEKGSNGDRLEGMVTAKTLLLCSVEIRRPVYP